MATLLGVCEDDSDEIHRPEVWHGAVISSRKGGTRGQDSSLSPITLCHPRHPPIEFCLVAAIKDKHLAPMFPSIGLTNLWIQLKVILPPRVRTVSDPEIDQSCAP